MNQSDENRGLEKAAQCGEPSYVWRAGQDRRLKLIFDAAEKRVHGRVLENGCGIGMYISHLQTYAEHVIGLEYDLARAIQARENTVEMKNTSVIGAAGESLPFEDGIFDVILSHEVLEHVQDDRKAVSEMVRTLQVGGRMIIFVPNRGYPFETHGIYWRGRYHFGNIPLVNYLPCSIRDQLAPHVRVYTRRDLNLLFQDLPVQVILQTVIFGAYDNIIDRWPKPGRILKRILHWFERTPLRSLGLSHFWVVEKID